MMDAVPKDSNTGLPEHLTFVKSSGQSAKVDGLEYVNDVTSTSIPATNTISPDRTASTSSPCATTAKLVQMPMFGGDQADEDALSSDERAGSHGTDLFPTMSDLISPKQPTRTPGMKTTLSRKESKDFAKRQGRQADFHQEKVHATHITSNHKKSLIVDAVYKQDKVDGHFFLKNDDFDAVTRRDDTDSPLATRGHEKDHRRSLPISNLNEPLTGQLGILKPMSGELGNAGVSQLIASLILAPMSAPNVSTPINDSETTFAPANDATNETSPTTSSSLNGNAFLLAPSSSSDGIKLQMVEFKSLNSMTDNRKKVQFQAILTNAKNEPRLYCAVLQPSASLRMELCDDSNVAVSNSQSRNLFLYDSETGEVTPSETGTDNTTGRFAQAPATTDDGGKAVDDAVAMSRSDKRHNNVIKRRWEAARLSMDSNGPQSVKLVFFADENTFYPDVGTSVEAPATPKESKHTRPPLLDPSQR